MLTFEEQKIDELEARLASANAIIDKLPKCWRLVDGVLVHDVPITAAGESNYFTIETNEAGQGKVVTAITVLAILGTQAVRCNVEGYRILTNVLRSANQIYFTREAAAAGQANGDVT